MPPTVEKITTIGSDTPSFSVDLDGPERFDPELFDQRARLVAAAGRTAFSKTLVKFVVVGSRMVVFPSDRSHVDTYVAMRADPTERAGLYSGDLVCAGMIGFGPTENDTKIIAQHSTTLENEGTLTREASDEFKLNDLKDKLGNYFYIQ